MNSLLLRNTSGKLNRVLNKSNVKIEYFRQFRLNLAIIILGLVLILLLSSCAVVELTGDTVVLGGKIARETVKLSSTVVGEGGKLGGAGLRYVAGARSVKLERNGNNFLVNARINGRHKARLLLDTGATYVQIPRKLALEEMGIDFEAKERVACTLADGSVVPAILLVLEELRVGGVKVKNVDAVVLLGDDPGESDGLLGMSFLNKFKFEIDTDKNLLFLK